MPARSVELEQFEAFSTPPLCQNDGSCLVVSGDSLQTGEVVWRRPRGRTSFRLNKHDLEEVAALETWAVLAVVLSDRDQVHNAPGFGLRLPSEVPQVPLCS